MQIVPMRDLKNTVEIERLCAESNEPVFVTKNGYNDMVIMSAEVYDRIRLYTVYEKMMEAEAELQAGRVKDAKASLAGLRAKYGL